jgi:hypothetical protein
VHVRKFFSLQVPAAIDEQANKNSNWRPGRAQTAAAFRDRLVLSLLAIAFLAAIAPQAHAQDGQVDNPAAQESTDGAAKDTSKSANSGHPKRVSSVPTSRVPASVLVQPAVSRFALAFKTSSLGLGADLGMRMFRPLNLRVGFGVFNYGESLKHEGVPFHGDLRLRSLQALVDWFPFAGNFHVSSGIAFNNSNRVTARSMPPPGEVQKIDNIIFISDPRNPITGIAKSTVAVAAPMILVGFGNLVSRNRHFAYSFDVGVVYQGRPTSSFVLMGRVCDPTLTICSDLANDVDTQQEVKSARRALDKSVSFLRFYPVISVEFGYRF